MNLKLFQKNNSVQFFCPTWYKHFLWLWVYNNYD